MTLADQLDALADAIAAAGELGLDASAANATRDIARDRLRFPGSTYVLALAGGTGVGKSSLLNAIAGTNVSRVAARRPTTAEPVAWIPRAARDELAPLLEWLGVRETHEHDDPRAAGVAVLDLPDLDSIVPEHRAKVDELLPRVDAVVWVADPEKYQDAVLHDDYMQRWMPRLERQVVVVNKSDRLGTEDAERIRRDLAQALPGDRGAIEVISASAASGEAGIERLRAWIAGGADAKRIVAERIAAEARAAIRELAERAGVATGAGELVPAARRASALRDMVG
ncbi:MAG: 50S ribosome-binding GTPase, partial [Chloroflexota bacterium]|nr:50S ribosome-binding GTPase [Chloroflexota bacterium]